jgi:MFS family permease
LFSGTANATHNAFFVPLLVQLGIGSLALGLYTAFNGLFTNASGLLIGRVGRRLPNPRALAIVSGGLGRAGFVLIALLLLLRGDDTPVSLLIAVALLGATLIGIGIPIVTTMVADAVPARERGAFFANRLLASGAGAAFVALVIAGILRQLAFPAGFTVAYVLAALAGVGSLLCLLSIRAPTPRVDASSGAPVATEHAPISAQMRRYALSTFVLWFGAAMVAPILTPYIIEDLGADPSFFGIMGAVNALTAISVQRFWGRRVDRLGAYGVVRICLIVVSTLPVLYAIAPTYWLAIGFEVVSGIGWAGYAIGSLNFALECAPERERARYSAVANAAAGAGAFLGPLVAAGLDVLLVDRSILILAGGVRLAAFFLMRLSRPQPEPVTGPAIAAAP